MVVSIVFPWRHVSNLHKIISCSPDEVYRNRPTGLTELQRPFVVWFNVRVGHSFLLSITLEGNLTVWRVFQTVFL